MSEVLPPHLPKHDDSDSGYESEDFCTPRAEGSVAYASRGVQTSDIFWASGTGTGTDSRTLGNPSYLLMPRVPSILESSEITPPPPRVAAPAMMLGKSSRQSRNRRHRQDRVAAEELMGVVSQGMGRESPGMGEVIPGRESPGIRSSGFSAFSPRSIERPRLSRQQSVESIRTTRRNHMVNAIGSDCSNNSAGSDQDLEGNYAHDDDHDGLESAMQHIDSALQHNKWAQRIGALAHLSLKLCGVLPLNNFSSAASVGAAGGEVEVQRRFCLRAALSGSYRALLLLTDVCFLLVTGKKLRSAFAPAVNSDLVLSKAVYSGSQLSLTHPLVTDLVVASAAVLTILACGMPYWEAWGLGRQIRKCRYALETISARTHCEVEWTIALCWDALYMFLAWLLFVGSRFGANLWLRQTVPDSSTSWDAALFFLFAVASAQVAAAGLLVVHLSCGMSLAINGFERKFLRLLESPQASRAFSAARLEWNRFSAAFRNTSVSLRWVFAVLAGAAVFSLFSGLLDAWLYSHSLGVVVPGIIHSLTILRVLLMAGATTDYCVKLPSLFTTVRTSSPQLEDGLLRLVQFLHATEAGFYVSETRVTTSGILKVAYITCMAAAAVSSELLS
ncbi:unnamed protein product [Polarella glacialis]|uniref:Uncharacterized protein n=1 Tax=Polarella glacialis TaxID=89957 RepID=A0A813EA10_POLGL|nr:unnamed protein product [Polarella glacialis]